MSHLFIFTASKKQSGGNASSPDETPHAFPSKRYIITVNWFKYFVRSSINKLIKLCQGFHRFTSFILYSGQHYVHSYFLTQIWQICIASYEKDCRMMSVLCSPTQPQVYFNAIHRYRKENASNLLLLCADFAYSFYGYQSSRYFPGNNSLLLSLLSIDVVHYTTHLI